MCEQTVECVVSPAINQKCVFETGLDAAGKSTQCPKRATLAIAGKALCDQHAELGMTAICGRNVKIERCV